MSRATGGARPWNESAGRVGQRHLPRPPTSALIDAPRQSNFRLRASFFVAIITTATTPDSHPDCRALLIQIVALQRIALGHRKMRFTGCKRRAEYHQTRRRLLPQTGGLSSGRVLQHE